MKPAWLRTVLALTFVVATSAAAAAADPAAEWAKKLTPQITAWRRDIHQHPELGNREVRTAKLVAAELEKLGLEVRTGVAHTGVVGILRGARPGPRIAIRADMDALPVTEEVDLPFASKARATYGGQEVGVMHACGHDAHTAMVLGVATALAAMRDDLAGEVMFVFQPAEEGAPPGEEGGAQLMLEEGLFDQFEPAAVFGMHVFSTLRAGEIGIREGPILAGSDRFQLTVRGRQTHGAVPWKGVDPIVTAAEIVGAAQTVVSRQLDLAKAPAVLTFGVFRGGVRNNIVPDRVELEGTIRTFDEGMRQELFARFRRIAEHVAAAQGASVDAEIPVGPGNPVTINDPALTRRMRPSLERAAGAGNVHDVAPLMVAEDFSFYARRVPGMFFLVGSVPPAEDPADAAANHSPKFFVDETALTVGTGAMLQVALDYLGTPPK